VEEERDFD